MQVLNVRTIGTPDWQIGISGLGDIVQDADDISQCIRTIILTRKGEDPLRPLFGCDVYNYIDRPIIQVRPLIVHEVSEAISLWEKRVKVLTVSAVIEDEILIVSITATFLQSGTTATLNIPVSGGMSYGEPESFSSGFSPAFS